MSANFDELVRVLARLRSPDGCPWDREQTHDSIKPNLLEETYEVLEALDRNSPEQLREELGDLLLQVIFHCQLASDSGAFTVDDMLQHLTEKLVRRHPHVFEETKTPDAPRTAEDVLARWEFIKQAERKGPGKKTSVMDGVAASLPALLRAYQVQARAARVGFDWSKLDDVLNKLDEEWNELKESWREAVREPGPKSRERVEEEFGDVLFSLVNLARFMKVESEEALRKTINRFVKRFRYIEEQAERTGRNLNDLTLEEMDRWWEEAKHLDDSSKT
ncbi:MAG: nucleoside triphosphate pyrophosphohydrolase [Candidatus Binatia bacterium]